MINKQTTTSQEELWFCLSVVDSKTLSLGGRLVIPKFYSPEILELVWYTSPRRIEEFNQNDFKYPFMRLSRCIGKLRYETEFMFIPDKYDNVDSVEKYQGEGIWAARKIWSHGNQIQELCDVIFDAGASEVSLEFRINAGHLAFIDWDTGIELM